MSCVHFVCHCYILCSFCVLVDPRQIDSRIRAADRNSFLENYSLSLIIGVPVAVVVVIVTVYMVWHRQKQTPKQQKPVVRHPAPPARRSPLPPPWRHNRHTSRLSSTNTRTLRCPPSSITSLQRPLENKSLTTTRIYTRV